MKEFKNILYLNEPTVDQASAVARAVTLAENNQAELTIADVIPSQAITTGIGLPPGGPTSEELHAAVKALELMIQNFREHARIRLVVWGGKTYLEAIRAVLKNGYDLLVKPAENPSWTQRIFGSNDLHLLRKCPCPVWLMKPPEKSIYSSILAAVDFDLFVSSPQEDHLNREILERAASVALSDSASLHIVHAWDAFAERILVSRADMTPESLSNYAKKEHERHRKKLYRLAEQLRGWIGDEAYDFLSPGIHLPAGPARKVIAPLAVRLRADLVVMGTVVRTGISGVFIGNTAEAILDQLTCSVLAIKPPGFKTPVKVDS